jgi:hypothetical protein
MSDQQCQDAIVIRVEDILGSPTNVHVVCELRLVDSRGVPRGHIHHRRTHDIPGVERAVTTWTRRP